MDVPLDQLVRNFFKTQIFAEDVVSRLNFAVQIVMAKPEAENPAVADEARLEKDVAHPGAGCALGHADQDRPVRVPHRSELVLQPSPAIPGPSARADAQNQDENEDHLPSPALFFLGPRSFSHVRSSHQERCFCQALVRSPISPGSATKT